MQPISPRTYKVIFLIIFLAIGLGVFAQAPNLLNYQGVARNAVGNPLPNQAMNLRLSVHNLSASGTVVYSETRPITTNLGGLFSVQIGSAGTTSSTGTIGGVNWLSGDKFLQVEIDPISNNNYLSLGTVQLVTVPYAFNAASAGNATTATKLAAPKNINGVSFDGTGDITVTADAGTLTGNTLKSTVTGSSLTSVGTLTNLTVTNPIAGSVTGNAATATNLTGLTTSVATLNNLSGVNTGDQTTITGNAATATKLAASKNINGVAFDGTADITIAAAAAAEQLTGTTLKSTVTGSSLTSVGTLTNLTVTNPIAGSITGNAATAITVTTNANLTGPVTSVGNATTITDGAITNAKITDVAATKITGTLAVANGGTGAATLTGLVKGNGTGTMTAAVAGTDYLTPTGSAAGLTNFPTFNQNTTGNAATATTATTVTTNANLTGDVTSVGNATTIGAGKVATGMIADNAATTAKIANANVTLAKLENLASGGIIVGNSSSRPTAVSISGDAVLSPTGELIITTGAITTSKIATGAVATASIADGAITNAKVTDVAATKITGTFTSATVNGKVIVGASSAASSSAVLEASSTTQGFLPPRMTSAQRVAISTPVAGLVVWCSDCGSNGELQVYNGTTWTNMIGGIASTPLITVGNAYQGGIIAYILVSGDPGYDATTPHGLIAATSDQSTGIQWYNGSYFIIGTTGTAIGTGSSNTTAIIASQLNTGSYAAKLCRDFRGGGYTDWYLPSMVELNKLILNKTAIGSFYDHSFYWSSSENPYGAAWSLRFYEGLQNAVSKSEQHYVRAVRSF